jgi:hypothetical protein
MSRVRSHHEGQMGVILEYERENNYNKGALLRQMMSESISSGALQVTKPMTYILAEKIRTTIERSFPIGSLRWRIIARIASKFLK